jgi:hypothetical protein
VRSEADVRAVLGLSAVGNTTSEIARRVGVARATVRAWKRLGEDDVLARRRHHAHVIDGSCAVTHGLHEPAYAYLLGQYLGDGCISRMRSSFRLRITCCSAYPKIIDECADAIRRLRPTGRVGFVNGQGCIEVCNYWLHWPCVLPHGEGGVKHRRAIALADWQRGIALDRHPQLFLRGLIHSDGWRGSNNVRGAGGRRYSYPRYQFSNRSEDIKRLFVEACERLGIETRRMNGFAISVAKRRSVALLDEFVGPKQ